MRAAPFYLMSRGLAVSFSLAPQIYKKDDTKCSMFIARNWSGADAVSCWRRGKVARQADGAVLVTYGDTTVLCTAVAMKSAKPGQDFFPLTVNYQEKTFAAGKIPGGFFKREGRPSEKETFGFAADRRPLRPLFVPGFVNETQVVCTVLSHDLENDPASSHGRRLRGLDDFGHPVPRADRRRAGRLIDDNYVLNRLWATCPRSRLDLVVAGTSEGVLMVEFAAKELSDNPMLGAVTFGHREFQPVIRAIIDLAETCAKRTMDLAADAAGKRRHRGAAARHGGASD